MSSAGDTLSAGDASTAREEEGLNLSGDLVVDDGCRERVKEKSLEGEDEEEGGRDVMVWMLRLSWFGDGGSSSLSSSAPSLSATLSIMLWGCGVSMAQRGGIGIGESEGGWCT